MDTVRAACALDYPPESYRIVVLDDSRSNSVRESVERLSREQNCKNLYYASRDVDVLSFSKFGNLSFGLGFVDGVPSGPSDFVAILDIDMIPLPYLLRAVIPYLVADGKVGLANPPQRFYNIPNQDPFVQNLDTVFDSLETIKDCVSSSWYKSPYQSSSSLPSDGFESRDTFWDRCSLQDKLDITGGAQ
ncbi:MAG: hypothetical protein ALECFALPRED_008669 [Alectoria fallacina]|uniref:Glycosyltransferase 2-like domain-containing protein n=1 Tax=Alectoria fallacina TaxID=1903189 RepID=A0A8H3PGN8_9LECA|nr:MAG: hypothetical protein ALECFALPRED_008669 [Alectoria fallacina]